MSLGGWETVLGDGQYRVFAEWANTNAYSLPCDRQPSFPAYVNGVYRQGYTHGARWVGSSQGSGSKVLTQGWMDGSAQRLIKWHQGTIHASVGAYDPRVRAPRGDLWGFSASQSVRWRGLNWTPEVVYLRLSDGEDQRANRRQSLRLGLLVDVPI